MVGHDDAREFGGKFGGFGDDPNATLGACGGGDDTTEIAAADIYGGIGALLRADAIGLEQKRRGNRAPNDQ